MVRPISTRADPPLATSVEQPIAGEASSEVTPTGTEVVKAPEKIQRLWQINRVSVLDGLNLDTAIRLRWALRDIKAGRTKFSPVSESDLMALIELGLIEMRDDVPSLPMRVIARFQRGWPKRLHISLSKKADKPPRPNG